jgi:hypothetical protein
MSQVVRVRSETQRIIVDPVTQAIAIISAGPPGPPGPAGPPGASGSGYNHTQGSAATTWTINHNLGFKPSVQTFTVGGLEIIGEVQHTSDNQVLVTFNIALAGIARLS